jgi:hypothetical protein
LPDERQQTSAARLLTGKLDPAAAVGETRKRSCSTGGRYRGPVRLIDEARQEEGAARAGGRRPRPRPHDQSGRHRLGATAQGRQQKDAASRGLALCKLEKRRCTEALAPILEDPLRRAGRAGPRAGRVLAGARQARGYLGRRCAGRIAVSSTPGWRRICDPRAQARQLRAGESNAVLAAERPAPRGWRSYAR